MEVLLKELGILKKIRDKVIASERCAATFINPQDAS